MGVTTVANVEEAIEVASSLKLAGKYNWFRGQVRADWVPSSTAQRKLQGGTTESEFNKDLDRFLDWVRLVPELAYLDDTANEHFLFAIRQHYGYPTTYIDFTSDPSVAGFFASDTPQPPEEGTFSAIFCLNTNDLLDFYHKHAQLIGEELEIEPVSVDVKNLWRLQAQHGHFLRANHTWYNVYSMDRIEFPWTGLPAYPPRDQIYPPQKSHLEQLLDEFESLERRRKGQEHMEKLLIDLEGQGVKILKELWITDPERYTKSAFSAAPILLESWNETALAPWRLERHENFHTVVGKTVHIRVRSGSGAPPAHQQVKAAFLNALSREMNLRASSSVWKIDGLEGIHDIDRYLSAIQSAWNGMRNIPYKDQDIASTMGALTQLFSISKCNSMIGHTMDHAFKQWIPDAFEIEFGCDILNTISRAHCSSHDILQCLDSNWKHSCKNQKTYSTPAGALSACSKPDHMFEFDAFASIFARQIIPAQLARERPLVLFNPARLSFFGIP
ncbi:FRG domain-containing protein [Comamonas sp. BIGb0124]|uniref:FRG domain-containing protein n=1 Tax=Comamonas sp. BIGb0124 TaxID=2485130 RepID=UPI000F48624F|nr:FRG domain-containing protein [Comamonas sp. BIGb0124]ROR21418.1 FRG domain-containing protein [Comamonas sp. BIGb0124]